MRRSPYLSIVQPLQRLTLASLVLYLTFPLATLELVPLRTAPASAQSSNNRKTEADRLLQEGYELFDSDRPQAALKLVQQALVIYREIKDSRGESDALKDIGNLFADLGDYKQAITNYQKSLEIAQDINDSDLETRDLSNLGLAYFHSGNTQRTNEYCQKALAIARQTTNYETEALALKCISVVHLVTSGNSEQGMNFLGQALEAIRKAKGDSQANIRQRRLEFLLLDSRGNFYYVFGYGKLKKKDETGHQLLNQSLQDRQAALKVAKQLGDTRRQAKALLGMGETYSIQNQYAKAVESFQQALQIFQANKNYRTQLRETYSKLGDVYYKWVQDKNQNIYYEEALKAYNQALKIIKTEIPNSAIDKLLQDASQGLLLLNIGNIYSDTSQYEPGINYYQDALKIFSSALEEAKKINDPIKNSQETLIKYGIQTIYVRMCANYKFLGRLEEAKKACQAAKDVRKNFGNFTLPKNLSVDKLKSTSATKSSDKIAQAEKDLQQAEEMLKEAQFFKNLNLELYALAMIGKAYSDLGKNQEAEKYFKQAIELSKTVAHPQYKPVVFFLIGDFYRKKQKNDDAAIKYYKQAGEYAKEGGYKLEEANIFAQIGMTSYLANKLPEATDALYRAVDVFDSIRDKLIIDGNRIAIFETQSKYFSLLQKVLIDQKKFPEALEVAERSRARAFIALLALRNAKKGNDKTNTELPEIIPPKIQELQRIAKQQNATIVEYAVPNPPLYDGVNDKDQPVWDGKEIYIWVVKPTGEVAFEFQKVTIPLQELVKTSRQDIGVDDRSIFDIKYSLPPTKINPEVVEKICKDLYLILIKPIAQYLPTNPNEKVIFIPQNQLFLVPFPALKDEDNKYLIEKHTILTAPAIQVLELTHQQRQQVTGTGALVVGNPTMPLFAKKGETPQRLRPLKNAEQEAIEIAQIFKTKSLIGKQATKSAVKQQMLNARFIHLATHGLLDDFGLGIPGAIALAPDSLPNGEKNDNNGWLTASEILDMKLKAELVVLSACQTGQGDIKGDGVIGLSRSLIAAGVPSVVVSLWNVPDESTKLLMTEFYRQMQQTPDKAQALRQAMLITMKKYSDPIHWAAFTLIGEST